MALNGFSTDLELDELNLVIDRGSGAITIAQRQANALVNLGIGAGTAANILTGQTTAGTLVNGKPAVILQFAAGTASQAPITMNAGTLLTTAAAGAIEYDGTAFYATAVASARQQVDAEQYTLLASNFTLTNGTAAQKAFNASTNGTITLVAGKAYMFEAMYNITNTGTTSHTWAVLFGGTATFTTFASQVFGNSSGTANAAATGGLSGFSTSATAAVVVTPASTSATEQATVEIMGSLVVNAGGTLIPQVQLSAAPGGTQTMLAGSYFRIWEMGGTGTVGNWS